MADLPPLNDIDTGGGEYVAFGDYVPALTFGGHSASAHSIAQTASPMPSPRHSTNLTSIGSNLSSPLLSSRSAVFPSSSSAEYTQKRRHEQQEEQARTRYAKVETLQLPKDAMIELARSGTKVSSGGARNEMLQTHMSIKLDNRSGFNMLEQANAGKRGGGGGGDAALYGQRSNRSTQLAPSPRATGLVPSPKDAMGLPGGDAGRIRRKIEGSATGPKSKPNILKLSMKKVDEVEPHLNRIDHTLGEYKGNVYCFGGRIVGANVTGTDSGQYVNNVHTFVANRSQWMEVPTKGSSVPVKQAGTGASTASIQQANIPSKRGNHTAVVRPECNTMLIFGGRKHTVLLADMFELNLETGEWSEVAQDASTGPGPVFGHSACYHPPSSVMFVTGGCHTNRHGETLVFAYHVKFRHWQRIAAPTCLLQVPSVLTTAEAAAADNDVDPWGTPRLNATFSGGDAPSGYPTPPVATRTSKEIPLRRLTCVVVLNKLYVYGFGGPTELLRFDLRGSNEPDGAKLQAPVVGDILWVDADDDDDEEALTGKRVGRGWVMVKTETPPGVVPAMPFLMFAPPVILRSSTINLLSLLKTSALISAGNSSSCAVTLPTITDELLWCYWCVAPPDDSDVVPPQLTTGGGAMPPGNLNGYGSLTPGMGPLMTSASSASECGQTQAVPPPNCAYRVDGSLFPLVFLWCYDFQRREWRVLPLENSNPTASTSMSTTMTVNRRVQEIAMALPQKRRPTLGANAPAPNNLLTSGYMGGGGLSAARLAKPGGKLKGELLEVCSAINMKYVNNFETKYGAVSVNGGMDVVFFGGCGERDQVTLRLTASAKEVHVSCLIDGRWEEHINSTAADNASVGGGGSRASLELNAHRSPMTFDALLSYRSAVLLSLSKPSASGQVIVSRLRSASTVGNTNLPQLPRNASVVGPLALTYNNNNQASFRSGNFGDSSAASSNNIPSTGQVVTIPLHPDYAVPYRLADGANCPTVTMAATGVEIDDWRALYYGSERTWLEKQVEELTAKERSWTRKHGNRPTVEYTGDPTDPKRAEALAVKKPQYMRATAASSGSRRHLDDAEIFEELMRREQQQQQDGDDAPAPLSKSATAVLNLSADGSLSLDRSIAPPAEVEEDSKDDEVSKAVKGGDDMPSSPLRATKSAFKMTPGGSASPTNSKSVKVEDPKLDDTLGDANATLTSMKSSRSFVRNKSFARKPATAPATVKLGVPLFSRAQISMSKAQRNQPAARAVLLWEVVRRAVFSGRLSVAALTSTLIRHRVVTEELLWPSQMALNQLPYASAAFRNDANANTVTTSVSLMPTPPRFARLGAPDAPPPGSSSKNRSDGAAFAMSTTGSVVPSLPLDLSIAPRPPCRSFNVVPPTSQYHERQFVRTLGVAGGELSTVTTTGVGGVRGTGEGKDAAPMQGMQLMLSQHGPSGLVRSRPLPTTMTRVQLPNPNGGKVTVNTDVLSPSEVLTGGGSIGEGAQLLSNLRMLIADATKRSVSSEAALRGDTLLSVRMKEPVITRAAVFEFPY